MNWFKVTAHAQTKLPQSNPLYILLSAIAHKASGILQVSFNKIVRQIVFQNGVAVAASSNLKSELPAYFLLKRHRIQDIELKQHIDRNEKGKVTDWKLLSRDFNIFEDELQSLQHEYVRQMISTISAVPLSEVSFVCHNMSSMHFSVTPSLWIMGLRSAVTAQQLFQSLPEFTKQSSVILNDDVDKLATTLHFSPEEKGLLVTIQNNSQIDEILKSSFLGEEKIITSIIFLSVAGCLTIKTQEMTNRERFISGLSDESRKQRDQIISEVESLDRKSYYEWIDARPDASHVEIKRKSEGMIEKYAAASVEKMFEGKDRAILQHYISKLNHARIILCDPNKRIQYNKKLLAGEHLAQDQEISSKDSSPLAIHLEAAKKSPKSEESLQTLSLEYEKGNKTPELVDALCLCLMAHGKDTEALHVVQDSFKVLPKSILLRTRLEMSFTAQARPFLIDCLSAALDQLHHYDLLGVPANASLEVIKESYRRLSKIYHPDLCASAGDPALTAKSNKLYKAMNRAFTTLKSPSQKMDYDKTLFSSKSSPILGGKNTMPITAHGIRFLKLAEESYRIGDLASAKKNLQMAMRVEPNCTYFDKKLREWS